MVRFENITEERISEKNKLNELQGLVKKVLGEDVKLSHVADSLFISTKDGEDIGAIHSYKHRMDLKHHEFEGKVREIGVGYEKIYGLDGKKKDLDGKEEEFVIKTDYS